MSVFPIHLLFEEVIYKISLLDDEIALLARRHTGVLVHSLDW